MKIFIIIFLLQMHIGLKDQLLVSLIINNRYWPPKKSISIDPYKYRYTKKVKSN